LTAAGQVQAQREQVDRIWRQRLERAGFAADRARRQYQLAEPENRLVVRQLERDWEAALAERQLWVPTISSTSRDQAIFVDHATGASLPSYAVLAENDRLC
jgi:thioesterase domain-containing protein